MRYLLLQYLNILSEWMAAIMNDIITLTSWPSIMVRDRKGRAQWLCWSIRCPPQVYRGAVCVIGSRHVILNWSWYLFTVKFPATGWCSARTVVNYQWNHYTSNTSRGKSEWIKGTKKKPHPTYCTLLIYHRTLSIWCSATVEICMCILYSVRLYMVKFCAQYTVDCNHIV